MTIENCQIQSPITAEQFFKIFCIGNANFSYFWDWECNFFLFFALEMQIFFIFCTGNANLFYFFHWECNFFFFCTGNANFFYFSHCECKLFAFLALMLPTKYMKMTQFLKHFCLKIHKTNNFLCNLYLTQKIKSFTFRLAKLRGSIKQVLSKRFTCKWNF